jgi:Tol biopolymer transport system component/DNA-binding winged helix-turn-helix (wHTH) protein
MPTLGDNVVYEFGPFRLDAGQRVLSRGETPVPLAPKVTETLLALVERAGTLVTKEDLMRSVWPDTFVEESNLAQNIFRLRKVLGGDDEQSYIETVPRRGYRFACPVRRPTVRIETPPVARQPRAPRWLIPAVAAAALLLVAGRYALSRPEPLNALSPTPPLPALEKVTTESRAYDPAISPDGRFVAYAVLDGEAKSIWLKDLNGGRPVQVAQPTTNDYRGLTFSPDGKEIFYKTYRPGGGEAFIMRMPALGGAPAEVAHDVWSDFAVSPDGARVAFIRGSSVPTQQMLLIVAEVHSGAERVIARNTVGHNWFALWDSGPSWSPDGERLAVCGGMRASSGDRDKIFEVRVNSGAIRPLRTPPWPSISHAAWRRGGGFIVVAAERESKPAQLWEMNEATGVARRLTNDLNAYGKLSLSADARLLVVEQNASFQHIWVVPNGDTARAKQLTFGATDTDGFNGLWWAGDGRILFASNRSGQNEIWSMASDGSAARQLTAESAGENRSPRATSDARTIVFVSNRAGKEQIWRMDGDGANPRQLTSGHTHGHPDVSEDGRWVYCVDGEVAPTAIERIPIDGENQERLPLRDGALAPAISPDGTMLEYNGLAAGQWYNGLIPVTGGVPRVFPWKADRGIVRWMPHGDALVYAGRGTVTNLWKQPLTGGAPQRITDFTHDHIWNFAVSPDGKSFVVSRGAGVSDIVLISGLSDRPAGDRP